MYGLSRKGVCGLVADDTGKTEAAAYFAAAFFAVMGFPADAVSAESAWTLLTRWLPRAVSGASQERRSRPLLLPATLSELIGSKECMPLRTPQGKREMLYPRR